MAQPDTTSWQLIHSAAQGDDEARGRFARQYERMIRDYLAKRWQKAPHLEALEDAVQEVFVECFRHRGVLDRVEEGRSGGFRAFFYGVIRNVALRFEKRHRGAHEFQLSTSFDADNLAASEISASKQFDRAWALNILRQAVRRLAERNRGRGREARLRVELLRLRFQEGLPIREIAKRWEVDSILLHRQYTKAQKEFRAVLADMLAAGRRLSPDEVEQELAELYQILRES